MCMDDQEEKHMLLPQYKEKIRGKKKETKNFANQAALSCIGLRCVLLSDEGCIVDIYPGWGDASWVEPYLRKESVGEVAWEDVKKVLICYLVTYTSGYNMSDLWDWCVDPTSTGPGLAVKLKLGVWADATSGDANARADTSIYIGTIHPKTILTKVYMHPLVHHPNTFIVSYGET